MGYGLSPIVFKGPSFVATALAANDPRLGDVMEYAGEIYRFCYNTGNSQISTGRGAILSAVSNYSVTVSSVTITDGNVAVGFCKHATILTGQYGWLLTQGFVSCIAADAAAVGNKLILGEDGGVVAKTTGIAQLGNDVGKALSALASGAQTGICWISLP